MKSHSAESCARTAYLFHRLYNEPDSPLGSGAFRPAPGYKLKGDDKRKYDSYFKENVFYKRGCSLGDKIQCYKHDINAFKVRIIGDYSNYASGFNALNYERKRELRNEIYRLEDKYIEGVAETRVGDKVQVRNEVFGAWYKKTTTVTIDEIKRQLKAKQIKKSKNDTATRTARKRAKKISTARQGSPFQLSKRFYGIKPKSNLANKVCASEFGSNYRLASWKDVKSYYSPSKIKEIKTLQSRYFISYEGSELSKYNNKYRHIFYFKSGSHTPKNDVSSYSKLSAFCINKRAPISSVKASSVVSSKTSLHSHAGRSHNHKLPLQGKAHRHGNGAIGE
jgi:hypothetical protein